MASCPNFFQKWLYSEEAKEGWEDIYRHLCGFQAKQANGNPEDDESFDETDTAVLAKAPSAAMVNSSVSWTEGVPCKHLPVATSHENDKYYTTLQYKRLTIKIFGKIPVGKSLIALTIYEVSLKFN